MTNSTEISYGGTGCLNGNSEESGSLKDADKMSEVINILIHEKIAGVIWL